jgi:type II secretory ATPase GspE/PulE/Tfp pilus assembly ATPase PilB-like protein
MANLDIAERRLPQSGKITMKYGQKDLELRVEVTATLHSILAYLNQAEVKSRTAEDPVSGEPLRGDGNG